MTPAPIIVFAYDRPDHLRQTLAALAGNDLAAESVLYVFCDGAREWGGELPNTKGDAPQILKEKDVSQTPKGDVSQILKEKDVSQVTASAAGANYITKRYGKMHCSKVEYEAYIQRIGATRRVAYEQTGFKEVHVVEREHNIGLADNIVGAVTEIVNQYGRVIAFEDDIVSTRGCLTYLNDALELYKDDEQVMHVSAWMYPNRGQFPTTFFYDSPYPAGGWATWKRAWQHFNPDTADHVRYWQGRWKEFDIEGENHLSKQLLMNLDGRLRTWYVKWYSSMRRCGGLCLYPGTAMSNNIGWDNSGETSLPNTRYFVEHPAEYTKVERVPIRRNRRAFRYIRVWYSGHWYSKRYRRRFMQWLRNILRNIKTRI